jgi:MFS transporter, DHA1 family, tetracycline resistance protein
MGFIVASNLPDERSMNLNFPNPTGSLKLFLLVIAAATSTSCSLAWTGSPKGTRPLLQGYHLMNSLRSNDDRRRRRGAANGERKKHAITAAAAASNPASNVDSNAPHATPSLVPWWSEPRHRSVCGVLSSSFLSLLGFTMVAGPLTPALGKHFGLQIGGWFGSLTSAYPLGMFLGILLWPSMSDRVGRRPILAVSLLGTGLGLVSQSLVIERGGSLTQFLLARALTGLFAGSSPVSKAYLADIGAKDGKLPRYLALKDASSTLAFILGPAAGGFLFDVRRKMVGAADHLSKEEVLLNTSGSLAFVIAVSAAASLLASLLAGVLVQESDISTTTPTAPLGKTTRKDKNSNTSFRVTAIDQPGEVVVSCPLGRSLWAGVASVCLVSFLFNVGDSTFHAFYSAFLKDQGMSVRDIGLLYTSMACVSFTVSSTTASALLKSIGPVLACATGLSMVGSGLLLLGLIASGSGFLQPSSALSAAAAGIYFCGVPIYGPTVSTMLLQCVPPNRRGFILGLDGSINTLARVVAPLAIGALYRKYNAGVAFGAAGIAVIIGAASALFRRYIVTREIAKPI